MESEARLLVLRDAKVKGMDRQHRRGFVNGTSVYECISHNHEYLRCKNNEVVDRDSEIVMVWMNWRRTVLNRLLIEGTYA